MSDRKKRGAVAVLASGGIDSAVLCVELLERFSSVQPIYVRFGLRWEAKELAGLRSFLDLADRQGLSPLQTIDEPVAEVYGEHWSLGGAQVPGEEEDDASVYLPGRTLLLVAKASLWCRRVGIRTLALGSLASNPFEDGRRPYLEALESLLNWGVENRLELIRPFERSNKLDVIRLGRDLPLGVTWSCLSPVGRLQCGVCNKCGERRSGFRMAGIPDPTSYAEAKAVARRGV